ncbi:MAG: WD40 repeat domain-containing protein [Cyanobacteria bacterium J06656_5]
MPKQILTQLSTHTVHLGAGNDQFEVMVNNLSDRFATFALELSASGVARQTTPDWYRLTPDLSAKIPAGDRVNFVVNILEVPPIPGGFTGKMNLNVNVTCLELGEEDRQLVNLVVAGSGVIPPTLKVPITDLQAVSGDLLEIPLQIYNANRNTANIRLALKGLPKAWLTEGHERRLQVASQGSAHGLFLCQPPMASEARVYPFYIEASQAEAPVVQQSGTLTVLPTGWVEFTCTADEADSAESTIKENKPVRYTLQLNNQSNVRQAVAMTLNRVDIPWYKKVWARVRRPRPASTTSHTLQLSPAQVELKAGDIAKMELTLSPVSPWLGWQQRQQFQLRPQLQQTEMRPPTQTVELLTNPKIPFWVQCLGIGSLSIAAMIAIYWPSGHRGPVNSVQFDGQANAIISGADDHTLHRWQVSPKLRDMATLKDTDKAIRVVRYRPRNNDLLAAGLENGEIQLWDFLSRQPPKSLVFQKDDRVFDLRFSHDSQSLFSAHGSGLILRWAIDELTDLSEDTIPKQRHQFGFAIQAIAPITYTSQNQQTHLLAVGGRFNRLVLWDFETDQQQTLDYPQGDPNHYLFSLDTADANPTRLATADNQGRITLWDLDKCLKDSTCRPSDQWENGHQGKPVNTVALSKNACYLVSGGDDGRVMLWSLNTLGQVMTHKQLAHFKKPVNSVDILQQDKALLVVSGSDTHRVKLHHTKANNKACP